MIHVNSISNSLYTTISSDATIVNSGVSVCLNEVFNTDPNMMPWVGIYTDPINVDPLRIGTNLPWRAEVNFTVYMQADSMESAQDANDQLERLMYPVLAAVNSNKNLDSTVHILTGISVDPFERNIEDEQWIFVNEATLTYILDI